jgi:signal transduction histidine kinase
MRRLRLALSPAGLALGIGAEVAGGEGAALTAVDLAAGLALVGLGLLAWERRPKSRTGALLAAGGVLWFLGNLAGWAVYLHRGPLIHLFLSYPGGRLRSRLDRGLAAAGYAYSLAYPVARNDEATIVLAAVVAAAALRRCLTASGPERRARAWALGAAAAFASVLALGASLRLAGVGADRAVLFAYDAVVGLAAAWLFAGLLWGRWAQATVTGLVVDLGEPGGGGNLRDRLARALGDPSLVLGYWVPAEGRYVDDAGRSVELAAGDGRSVTPIEQDGQPVAALVHDASVLGEPGLVADVAAAAGLAVSNVRLQAEVRARVAEVEASRRRIVEAADAQRRRLEEQLRDGAERRLARVAELLSPLDEIGAAVGAARAELRELARGIHPAVLADRGLPAALAELASRSPVPVSVDVPALRLAPPVEAAVYFLGAEALTNVAKYAEASRVTVRVAAANGVVRVEVADDGVGGADPAHGSGLRGLADRVEALGGRLRVESPPGGGTRLLAELPIERAP